MVKLLSQGGICMNYEEFENKVKTLGVKIGFLNKPIFRGLADMVSDGDKIIAVSECMGSAGAGAIVITEKNFYSAVFNKLTSADKTTIPLQKISSYSTSGMGGLNMTVTEGTNRYNYKIVSKSQDIINAIKKGSESDFPAQTKSDPAEELRKYKALLDDGIITQEDFDKKKASLLGL
jgi:hypothetical protein